jgi:transmembrane sensor
MSRTEIEDMLGRYVKGEVSEKESRRIEAWLDENGNSDSEWQQMDKARRDRWLANVFGDIRQSIRSEAKAIVLKKRSAWRNIAAVAAVFALFFSLWLEWPALQSSLSPVRLTTITVSAKQKKQVVLPDGSIVWINSSSQIKYPLKFKNTIREVYLAGEAYFDIKHNASRPFIIHTGKVITTVLGTAFNIKEDRLNHTVVVTVTRGKVNVADGNQSLGTLTPNHQITFNTLSNKHIQNSIDAEKVIAWQENYIHFNDITFAEATARLEQRFKVKIRFANDKVKDCQFTGTALKQQKLENILKVICAFNEATYRTNADGTIIIDGPGCD